MLKRSLAPLLFVFAFGCGSSTKDNSFENGDGGAGNGTGNGNQDPDSGFFDPGTGPGTTPNGDGCSDAAKLIYLFTQTADLYSFYPPTKTMTRIGRLSCSATGSPNSMAVGRDATAWVNYSDGSLFKVNTKDASCTPTGFKEAGWTQFGMGFSTNGATATDETLFVGGTTGQGLATIDLSGATPRLKMVSTFKGDFAKLSPELTGTGDGRLFGFFVADGASATPAQVGEIGKGNAAVTSPKVMNDLKNISAWAFSFWGGDFYLYSAKTETSGGLGLPVDKPSIVTRYKPSDGSVAVYMPQVPGDVRIVGAGVSTCAPTTGPK